MSAKYFPLFLCLLFPGSLTVSALSWEEALEGAPYEKKYFSETPFIFILRDILNATDAYYNSESLPAPEIHPQEEGIDLDKLITTHIPELTSRQAVDYLGRQSGYRMQVRGNRFTIARSPGRNPQSLKKLNEELTMQELLYLNFKEPVDEIERELLDYAAHRVSHARFLRIGSADKERPPIEFIAIALLLNTDNPGKLLRELLPNATPAGYFYLAAAMQSLDRTPPHPESGDPVPIQESDGRILLESAETLHQEFIKSGSLLNLMRASLKKEE